MRLFEFTVLLDHAPDEAGLDALFEAGVDDGSVEIARDGRAVVQVARRAELLTQAITSVVAQIEAAGFAATGIQAEDWVSAAVIGDRLGRTRESVRLWAAGRRGPGGFPAPVVGGRRALYSWVQVRQWVRAHYGDTIAGEADEDGDTLAAADLLLRARLLAPDMSGLAGLVAV